MIFGKSTEIADILSTSSPNFIDISVQTINASTVDGKILLIFLGTPNTIASVNIPINRAS